MSNRDPFNPSEALVDLSESQQESLSGGMLRISLKEYDGSDTTDNFVFFQQTAIDTFGEGQTQISSGESGPSLSSSSRSAYSLRQTTFTFSFGNTRSSFTSFFNFFKSLLG